MFLFPQFAESQHKHSAIQLGKLIAVKVLGNLDQLPFHRIGSNDNRVDLDPLVQFCRPQTMAASHQGIRCRPLVGGRCLAKRDGVDQTTLGHGRSNGQSVVIIHRARADTDVDTGKRNTGKLGHQAASSIRAYSEARAAAAILQ